MKHKNKASWLILESDAAARLFKTLLVFFALVQPVDVAFPCSAIFREKSPNEMLLGGNFDWSARGGILYLSPRQQIKSASFNGNTMVKTASWTSKYASLTLSQFGRDYPMQGMNEAGLAGAVLMAPAQYPASGSEGVITENLWLQHQLDRFATISEVALHAEDLGIYKISAELHWMLCDKTGECAIVEFIEGRPHIYRSRDERRNILTNLPYDLAWQTYIDWSTSDRPLPLGYQSSSRFIRLADGQNSRNYISIEDALDDVAFNGFTAWQTIFQLSTISLKFRVEGGSWEHVAFDEADLKCRQKLPMYELGKGRWTSYDPQVVGNLLERATQGIPKDEVSLIVDAKLRSEQISCSNSGSH